MRSSGRSTAAMLALFFAIQPELTQFKAALPGYRYDFPRDYFNHPEYQTEWWYYTGNLQSADGHRFGFELTFFREGVSRQLATGSSWDIRDLYLAHFAVSDLDGKKFLHTERSNRAGPGIAGADAALQKVWNGNWSVVWTNGEEKLTALADQFAVELVLQPQKPPVIHGANGISQKAQGAGRASHYFSETRLQATGTVEIATAKYKVSGQAWMDHEFFTQQLEENQAGWDWLSVQLDDNTELMLFRMRRKDGSVDPFSAGTFVDVQGRSRNLAANDFQLTPTGESWTSPKTGARYPIGWKILVPSVGIAVEASTSLPWQELTGESKIAPNYWEGAMTFTGTKHWSLIRGRGYLEMTGYDRPVKLP
jgi:predicted secreted hydrolase